jgi:hypothetical protein
VEREGVCVLCGVLGMEAYYNHRTQINGTSSCVYGGRELVRGEELCFVRVHMYIRKGTPPP